MFYGERLKNAKYFVQKIEEYISAMGAILGNDGKLKVVVTYMNEIEKLKECFVEQLLPIRVYLFGSFANNTYTSESDLDFYIVVQDDITDIPAETARAYKAIRKIKQHPVDILLGTKSRFEERKGIPSVENEVYRKGVLLYDAGNQRVV